MEKLPKNIILCFNSDTLEAVRNDINLDKPGRLDAAIDILEEWVKMQNHFVRKDFSRDYLERTLLVSKGLVERAKQKIDKMCTLRTLMPEFFVSCDPKKEFSDLAVSTHHAHLPKLTKEQYRVHLQRMHSEDLDSSIILKYYRNIIMLSEYMRKYDYCSGFQLIIDVRDVNVVNFVTKINPLSLRQMMTLLLDGFGLRAKGIHLLSTSKMVDAFVSLLKQVLSSKLSDRIRIHKTPESLYEYVPKEILPVDYGGAEKSLKELNDEWLDVLSSQDFIKYFEEMQKASTDERYRQSDQFNQEYIGTPGSFRALTVD